MPNWASQGLFTDITDRIATLPYVAGVAPAHIDASTVDGKQYGLPFIMDLSVWMYNKELFRQAGLDPEDPPTTLAEFDAAARAVGDAISTPADGTSMHGRTSAARVGGLDTRRLWWPRRAAKAKAGHEPRGHRVEPQLIRKR